MTTESNITEGVAFKSPVSGLWYRNKDAAGDIDAVMVDGVRFERKKEIECGVKRCDKHGGFGFSSDCEVCDRESHPQ